MLDFWWLTHSHSHKRWTKQQNKKPTISRKKTRKSIINKMNRNKKNILSNNDYMSHASVMLPLSIRYRFIINQIVQIWLADEHADWMLRLSEIWCNARVLYGFDRFCLFVQKYTTCLTLVFNAFTLYISSFAPFYVNKYAFDMAYKNSDKQDLFKWKM